MDPVHRRKLQEMLTRFNKLKATVYRNMLIILWYSCTSFCDIEFHVERMMAVVLLWLIIGEA